MSAMEVEKVTVPGWLTLNESARLLGVTRQAVGQMAMRFGWKRGRLDKMVLISEVDVELYRRTHQARKPRPAAPPA